MLAAIFKRWRYSIWPYVRKYSVMGRQKGQKSILYYINEQVARLLRDTMCWPLKLLSKQVKQLLLMSQQQPWWFLVICLFEFCCQRARNGIGEASASFGQSHCSNYILPGLTENQGKNIKSHKRECRVTSVFWLCFWDILALTTWSGNVASREVKLFLTWPVLLQWTHHTMCIATRQSRANKSEFACTDSHSENEDNLWMLFFSHPLLSRQGNEPYGQGTLPASATALLVCVESSMQLSLFVSKCTNSQSVGLNLPQQRAGSFPLPHCA